MNAGARRIVVLVAALVGMSVTARLGWWQLDRAAQKHELQAALDTRGAMPALSSIDLAATPALAETQHYRRVRLHGTWKAGATVFLDNRQMDGRPGFFVVTPLEVAGRRDAVLVQRGWVPRQPDDRSAVPKIIDSAGEIEVEGLIAPPPGRLLDFGSPGSGVIRQNLVLNDYAREVGLTLLPLSIEQTDSASTAGDGVIRRWPAPALDIDRHYGYMVQWFGLCGLIAGLYLWFQVIRPWRSRVSEPDPRPDSSPRAHSIANPEVR